MKTHLIQLTEKYSARNYHPLPIVLEKGKGSWVWDVEGKKYLDFLSCYSALNMGHQHPRIVAALKQQVDLLAVCSRAFYSKEFALFCEELCEFSGFDSACIMNTGTEAVETAIKLSRKWGYVEKKVPENEAKIAVLENNFHGRSTTVVSFSSEPLYREAFGPFTPGFVQVPFNDLPALQEVLQDPHMVAVLMEPIQAEAGILIPDSGYLEKAKKLCKAYNVLWILDEIQTGLGRTGKNFCFEHESAKPDILVLGKSLGGGLLPISSVLASKAVMGLFTPGEHGSTFGGNPLACHVGRMALKILKEEDLAGHAAKIEGLLRGWYESLKSARVKSMRVRGALMGIELLEEEGGARPFCEKMAQEGVLVKETHDHVIRIAPPLNIQVEDLTLGLEIIKRVLEN